MRILIADDEFLLMEHLAKIVRELMPGEEIRTHQNADSLLADAKAGGVDIAFLDICMPEVDGIAVAESLNALNPRVNLIFVTGFNDYREQAMDLFASGYVKKPATREKVQAQLEHLRYPIAEKPCMHIRVKPSFEASVGGVPIRFTRKKTLEFLAYLIYRQGNPVSSAQIRQILFGDSSTALDKSNSYFTHIKRDLQETFAAAGVEDLLDFQPKRDYYIDMRKLDCDLTGDSLSHALRRQFGWKG